MTSPSPSPASMEKIEVIQRSLRCFTLGLIGLLPGLGLPFAVMALANYFQVQSGIGIQWNPAQQYLTWGMATALSGLFLTLVLAVVMGAILFLNLA